MSKKKIHLYVDSQERALLLHSLVELKKSDMIFKLCKRIWEINCVKCKKFRYAE